MKILLYYSPFDDATVNEIKSAFIERIGAECEFYQIPFFLEFVGYDPKGGNEKGLEFAKIKPQVVIGAMKEFTQPQYNVDVLKVEVPVNAEFVEGSSVYKGEKAYTRAEALAYYREAAEVATKPFIYLSAGVGNAQFVESLNMATEAGTDYSGVLCGRRPGRTAMPIYATKGPNALEDWLSDQGVKNIEAVNAALRARRLGPRSSESQPRHRPGAISPAARILRGKRHGVGASVPRTDMEFSRGCADGQSDWFVS